MRLLGKRKSYEVDVDKAMDEWGDTVLRMAVRRLGNVHDAEDVFQVVFMRLLRSKEKIVDDEHLKAWLLRVTLNCCYDVLRRKKPTVALDEADGLEAEKGLSLSEIALHKALEALSPSQKTAVHLYYFEGYSTDEIAAITGDKPSTVRSHLHRARKALRITLEGADDE